MRTNEQAVRERGWSRAGRLWVGIGLLWVGLPCGALAQTVELRFHSLLPPNATAHRLFMEPWCERIEAASEGELRCQLYPSMSLGGSPPQLYDQVRDGVVDLTWSLPGYTAGRFPKVEVFELPFVMKSVEATSRALWDYVQEHAAEEFEEVHLLAMSTHGPGVLHLRDEPVHTLEDLRGRKIRAASRMTTRLLSALGASPVGMPVTALPEALSRGVVDGALLPWEVVPSVKVHELTQHHAETDARLPALYTQAFFFAMNKKRYESLSPRAKKAIDDNSGAELSGWIGRVLHEADQPARELAEARGNEFHTLSGEELERWRAASRAVVDEWLREGGEGGEREALLNASRELIERHEALLSGS